MHAAVTHDVRVMVVDDDPVEHELLRRAFRSRGLDVAITCTSGVDEAIAHLAENEDLPDLLLVDVHMPTRSGLDLLRHLQDNTRLGAIPAVAMSSWSPPDVREQVMAAGAVAYHPRPLSLARYGLLLEGLVERHVGASERQRKAPRRTSLDG